MFNKQQKWNESQNSINDKFLGAIEKHTSSIDRLISIVDILIDTHPNKTMITKQLRDVNKKDN